ncbi:MAG: nitrate/nitrite transporter NrtS [Chloroflexota bacterium]|nr:nitrate/nitrite transporter NrtS [Chloroflexota bacterium]
MKRSTVASLVVGTVLVLLNQGDFVFSGHFYGAMIWKIPLTFAVPFVVATWGAIMNCRRVEES